MILEIPQGFTFRSDSNNSRNNYAYEKDGKLIIVGNVSFERLMYDLTYSLSDSEHCCYCGCELTPELRTLDHLYPKDFGGITLPINLLPCCKSCNEKKSNLTFEQYKQWSSLRSENSQKEFRINALEQNQKYQENNGFLLPEDWISSHKISRILAEIDLDHSYYKGKRYKKIKTFYKKTGYVPRPIILSSNNVLLDGFLILMYAKNFKITHLPAIILQNVIVT